MTKARYNSVYMNYGMTSDFLKLKKKKQNIKKSLNGVGVMELHLNDGQPIRVVKRKRED